MKLAGSGIAISLEIFAFARIHINLIKIKGAVLNNMSEIIDKLTELEKKVSAIWRLL